MDDLVVMSTGGKYRVYLSGSANDYSERDSFYDALKDFLEKHNKRFGIGRVLLYSQLNLPELEKVVLGPITTV